MCGVENGLENPALALDGQLKMATAAECSGQTSVLLQCCKSQFEDTAWYISFKGRQMLYFGRTIVKTAYEMHTDFQKNYPNSVLACRVNLITAMKVIQEINKVGNSLNDLGLRIMKVGQDLEELNIFDGKKMPLKTSTPRQNNEEVSFDTTITIINSIISAKKEIEAGTSTIYETTLNLESLRGNYLKFAVVPNQNCSIKGYRTAAQPTDLCINLCSLGSGHCTIVSGISALEGIIHNCNGIGLMVPEGRFSDASDLYLHSSLKSTNTDQDISSQNSLPKSNSTSKKTKRLSLTRPEKNYKLNKISSFPNLKYPRIRKKSQNSASRPKWKY